MMSLHDDLRALDLASIGLSKLAGLPTWAIDFQSCQPWIASMDFTLLLETGIRGSRLVDLNEFDFPWFAAYRFKVNPKGSVTLSTDSRYLTVSGQVVDVVKASIQLPLSPSITRNKDVLSQVKAVYQALRQFKSPATQSMMKYRYNKLSRSHRHQRRNKVPEKCSSGVHDQSCLKFHSSVDTKVELREIKRGPSSRKLSGGKLIQLFNNLYTEFQSRLIDHRFHDPDIHVPPARYPTRPTTNIGFAENRTWIYHGRDRYELNIFTTVHGSVGLSTTDVRQGDTIALLHLHQRPCVLRPQPNGNFTFHGFVTVETTASGDLETFHGNDSFASGSFTLC